MQINSLAIFPSKLGWMALVTAGGTVRQLTFGHPSSAAAKRAIDPELLENAKQTEKKTPLVRRSGGTSLSVAKGVENGETTPFATLRDVPPIPHSKFDKALVRRLQAYASGEPDSFVGVAVDLERFTPFQRRVMAECRRIPLGSTATYSQLAARAGSPHAARAVGNCMAANRIPLIIPCHRVVLAGGTLGPYSAAGGTAMKRRLLALESEKLA